MKLIIHTDGGARGNPGPAGIGIVIEAMGERPVEIAKAVGITTNNVAEYTAVKEALKYIKENFVKRAGERLSLEFFLDSLLVTQQLNGIFRVKDAKLRELLMQVRVSESEIGGDIRYTYVPREKNQRADFLYNRAVDNASGI